MSMFVGVKMMISDSKTIITLTEFYAEICFAKETTFNLSVI